MSPASSDRSKKVVGIFLAAALTVTPWCSMNPFEWGRGESYCTDANNDGFCDEDGRPVSTSGSRYYRSGYWGTTHYGGGSSGASTGVTGSPSSHGVSSGSKGGIGSSSRSGGGSSGG